MVVPSSSFFSPLKSPYLSSSLSLSLHQKVVAARRPIVASRPARTVNKLAMSLNKKSTHGINMKYEPYNLEINNDGEHCGDVVTARVTATQFFMERCKNL